MSYRGPKKRAYYTTLHGITPENASQKSFSHTLRHLHRHLEEPVGGDLVWRVIPNAPHPYSHGADLRFTASFRELTASYSNLTASFCDSTAAFPSPTALDRKSTVPFVPSRLFVTRQAESHYEHPHGVLATFFTLLVALAFMAHLLHQTPSVIPYPRPCMVLHTCPRNYGSTSSTLKKRRDALFSSVTSGQSTSSRFTAPFTLYVAGTFHLD